MPSAWEGWRSETVAEYPEALEVTLRSFRPRAPAFHRHIVRAKLVGSVCRPGDRVVVYDVSGTEPDGPVRVTERTLLRFE